MGKWRNVTWLNWPITMSQLYARLWALRCGSSLSYIHSSISPSKHEGGISAFVELCARVLVWSFCETEGRRLWRYLLEHLRQLNKHECSSCMSGIVAIISTVCSMHKLSEEVQPEIARGRNWSGKPDRDWDGISEDLCPSQRERWEICKSDLDQNRGGGRIE